MSTQSLRALLAQARIQGYEVIEAKQLRPNRWLLLLRDAGGVVAVLAQQRWLISAADVQDLADIVRLQRVGGGVLLALGGTFSPAAWQTAAEFGCSLRLVVELPQAFSKKADSRVPEGVLELG